MRVSLNRIGAISAGGILCVIVAYFSALSFWLKRNGPTLPAAPEEAVMETGTISTNGWEFTITEAIDFGRRGARHLSFSASTRQIFVAFSDQDDDGISQWDIDTRQLARVFHLGKGFIPYDHAISPDGRLLIAERLNIEPPIGRAGELETWIIDVRSGRVLHEFGEIGWWNSDRLRFARDGKSVWLPATSLTNWENGVAFALDGTHIPNASRDDFPAPRSNKLWVVPVSKGAQKTNGLFYSDHSGVTNFITNDPWGENYATTKDGRLVLVATWHDDIIFWDAETRREIARQRVTNHHNGAGLVLYDEAKDRFLIGDPSGKGVKYLRAITVAKRPPPGPDQEKSAAVGVGHGANP